MRILTHGPIAARRRPGERQRGLFETLHLDLSLLCALLLLAGLGMMVLFSAGQQDTSVLVKQSIRLAVAFTVLFLVAQVPPNVIRLWTPWVFLAGLALLVAVLVFGDVSKGAQRWLDLGLVRFQPSEIMKLAVPLMLAWYLAESPLPPTLPRVIGATALILAPAFLIGKQPDLGTAVLVASSGAAALFLAGLHWAYIAGAALAAGTAAPVLWYLLHDYQRQRILTFLSPETDPLGSGYHIIQSKIAVGSGGLYGKGWLNGTQSHLEFLPERSTDFIFAVLAEEFGLTGILILLGVYLFIVVRGMYIATRAQDTFGRLVAGSLTLTFFVYVFVNAGMVTGLLPVVGVPLPLVSYGGSSMVTLIGAFGILMSVHTHRKLLPT